MPYLPFRIFHLHNLLVDYAHQPLPVDLFIYHYFRANKALGPQDRGFIAETFYGLIRWQRLIDYLTSGNPDWEVRIKAFLEADIKQLSLDPSIPILDRISFPQVLFDAIVDSHGMERAIELCRICNFPAPTTIRVNTLKTSREALFSEWNDYYDMSLCKTSSTGIIFHKKISFFALEEFTKGFFEVQDEGSQILAHLVQAKPGDQVLDYCSGSGGKTLAFAPFMEGKGQIFLHDVRSHALVECRKRLKRAGVQNSQIVHAEDTARLNKLKKRMDWILVDAPCTGTGTLRRNPDMKWKYESSTLQRLVGLQRQIFERGLSYLKPGGKIVYGTCSLLNEENKQQMEHFIKTYDLQLVGTPFESLPSDGGMDGFFGAVFERK